MKSYCRYFCSISLVVLMAMGICGCAVISYIAGQFQRPKKVEALFHLPQDASALVLVESTYELNDNSITHDLTEELNKELLTHELVRRVIPYDDLATLRCSEPDYNDLAITQIGQKLNADIVLYVHISRFSLKDIPDDVMWQGRCETWVKVIKANAPFAAARLWPKHQPIGGHSVDPIVMDPTANSNPNYDRRLTKALVRRMADRIAKLFYDHRLTGIDAWEGKASGDTEKVPM